RPFRASDSASVWGAVPPTPPQASLREPPSTLNPAASRLGGCPRWSIRSPLDPASSSRHWALKDRRGLVAPLLRGAADGIVGITVAAVPRRGPSDWLTPRRTHDTHQQPT